MILRDFLIDIRTDLYWFWDKGKITRKRKLSYSLTEKIDQNVLVIYEQNLSGTCEWNGIRLKNGFYNIFDKFETEYMSKIYETNGQTKSEFEKNWTRVKDIFIKSDGDVDKMISLSKTQANRIHDEFKAINRALAAKSLGYEEIFEVFFQRAYELGSVSKQDYREYKLKKLGI
jgi:hypothetical protein